MDAETRRVNIAAALMELSDTARQCRADVRIAGDPPTDSTAARYRKADARLANTSRGPSPVRHAQGEAVLCTGAAADHLLAIAATLVTPGIQGYSVATLARGAVEAAGRAWWLLSAGGPEELTRRWLATRVNSLRWLVKATADDPIAHGENSQLLDTLTADAQALGASKADLKLSYTRLATEAINVAVEPGAGETLYASLSAVAHAERSGLAMMLVRTGPAATPETSRWRAGLTDTVLADVLLPALAVHSLVQSAMTDYFGVPEATTKRWSTAMHRCFDLLQRFDTAADDRSR